MKLFMICFRNDDRGLFVSRFLLDMTYIQAFMLRT